MKVLVNFLSAVSGGSITYLQNVVSPLAKVFDEDGKHELHILIHRSQLPLLPQNSSAKLHILEGRLPRSYKRILWERRHIDNHVKGMDVYFIPYQVGYFPRTVRSVLMLRNMEPFFHWRYPYGMSARLRLVTLNLMSFSNLRRAGRVIAVSNFAADYLSKKIKVPSDRSVVVRHGCDPIYRGRPEETDVHTLAMFGIAGEYLFTSGSLLPYRRLEDIIEAFALFCRHQSRLSLVVSGPFHNDEYVAKIKAAISDSGVSDKIILTGSVSRDVLAIFYRNSFAFVLASEIEACPNTVIEGLASGCATVAPKHAPFPEFIGQNGLYFPSRDADALAAAMKSVTENSNLRNELQAGALEASRIFTWDRCARETYEALTVW